MKNVEPLIGKFQEEFKEAIKKLESPEDKQYTPIKKVDYPVLADPSTLYPPKIP
jgi:hypothetical protein